MTGIGNGERKATEKTTAGPLNKLRAGSPTALRMTSVDSEFAFRRRKKRRGDCFPHGLASQPKPRHFAA
jgi:hypothetical protein